MSVWKASNERVVIQVIEKPKETDTGIILPEKTKNGPVSQGIILAVGGEVKGLLPGDRAFFESKYATQVEGGVVSIEAISVLAGVRDE